MERSLNPWVTVISNLYPIYRVFFIFMDYFPAKRKVGFPLPCLITSGQMKIHTGHPFNPRWLRPRFPAHELWFAYVYIYIYIYWSVCVCLSINLFIYSFIHVYIDRRSDNHWQSHVIPFIITVVSSAATAQTQPSRQRGCPSTATRENAQKWSLTWEDSEATNVGTPKEPKMLDNVGWSWMVVSFCFFFC